MFLVSASTLLLLLVTVVAQMPWPKERPGGFHIEDFPMLNIVERTAIDPYLYLSKPELGFPKLFRCLPREEGVVDYIGCSVVNSQWQKLLNGDGNLVVTGGQCKSITQTCCQTTICAPKEVDVILTVTEMDRLFFKFSEKCLSHTKGALYVTTGWDNVIMTSRPPRCIQKGHRPDSNRRSLMNESYWES
ncbi:hypothetical protein LI328DRAFT_160861 [Trichoderma asperelloides]|nr:hypothetical protein LI328DRAFT_160861 [Trichoderma asperelloides]